MSLNEIFRETLKQGCDRLSTSSRQAIASYIRSQEAATGGFMNKAGQPDLYYTFFGLICALLLDVKVNIKQHKMFLNQFRNQLDLPHFAAHVQSANLLKALSIPSFLQKQSIRAASHFVPEGIVQGLNTLLHDQSRVPLNDPNSPYTVFLAATIAGTKSLSPGWHSEHAFAYQTPSGGWSNIRDGSSPSLNATVSAMMVLHLMKMPVDTQTINWLKDQQHPSGGFAAVPGAPVPDLLSTATALLALKTSCAAPLYPVTEFIQAHWRDNGGFSGTFMDEATDCEYTFYGLLALGAGIKT